MRFYLLVLLLVAIVAAAPRLNNIRHKASTPSHAYQHHLGKRDVNELADANSSSQEDIEDEFYSDDDKEEEEDDVIPDLKETEAEDDETADEEADEAEDPHGGRASHRHGFKPTDEML